jgi:hypothetical protein
VEKEKAVTTQHAVKAKYVASISEAELACRLIEAVFQMKRPPNASPEEVLDGMEAADRQIWRTAARAAMEYWRECIDNANRPN